MPYPLVEYPFHNFAGRPLAVEALSQERARELATPILGLVVAGYSHQYEGPGEPLDVGAFAGKYDNNAARERWHDEIVPGVYARDGLYYAVADPGTPGQLAAVFKALPGAAAEDRFQDRQLGIAEVIVRPRWQGRGLAAAALLAHLEHGGLNPDDKGMSDVIDGSPMAAWLWTLHFKKELPSGELRLDAWNTLPTHYYLTDIDLVAEFEVTVASLTEEIKERHPSLTTSRTESR